MFKTARFKVHNPSRHKSTMLWYAMTQYHETLKSVLEHALALSDLLERVSEPDKKGKLRPNKFRLSKMLYTIAPQHWELAPLRDYLIGDASAMLMSHLSKTYKGENDSNPPSLQRLEAMTDGEFLKAYRDFTDPEAELAVKPQHQEKIDKALASDEVRVARRLTKIYTNWAISRSAGEVLRKLEGPLPHPIEFTRNEFSRGCLLAYCDGNYYLLVRLFASSHRYWSRKVLAEGFTDCKTRQPLGGNAYPGIILPLELGRDFHEREYLTHGAIQSAKLVVKRRSDRLSRKDQALPIEPEMMPFNAADYDFYVHAAFEFNPPPVETTTFLGIDRGAAKLGAATLIDRYGKVIEADLDLDGAAFTAEMRRHEQWIKQMQKTGRQRSRRLSIRGKRADMILGEYANRIVAIAKDNRSQIVIESIRGVTMGRFLKQSQFAKLKEMLTYKAEREGLPSPIEVPAAFTSQTCGECGYKDAANRRRKGEDGKATQDRFKCVLCGFAANADSNASRIIAFRGLHQVENGGKFKKFDLFQQWMKNRIGRDGSIALGQEIQ